MGTSMVGKSLGVALGTVWNGEVLSQGGRGSARSEPGKWGGTEISRQVEPRS